MDLIVWMSQTSPKMQMTKELMEKNIEFSVIRNIEIDGIVYSYAIVLKKKTWNLINIFMKTYI